MPTASAVSGLGDVTYTIGFRCIQDATSSTEDNQAIQEAIEEELAQNYPDAPANANAATLTTCPEDHLDIEPSTPFSTGAGITITENSRFFQFNGKHYEGDAACHWDANGALGNGFWYSDGGIWYTDFGGADAMGDLSIGTVSVPTGLSVPTYTVAPYKETNNAVGKRVCPTQLQFQMTSGSLAATTRGQGFGPAASLDSSAGVDLLGLVSYGNTGIGAFDGDMTSCKVSFSGFGDGALDVAGYTIRLGSLTAAGVCGLVPDPVPIMVGVEEAVGEYQQTIGEALEG